MADFKKINWNDYNLKGMSQYFSRTNPVPLDKTEVYYSLEEAKAYAEGISGKTAYAGQIISVVDFVNSAVTTYKICIDRSLEKLGSGDSSLSAQTYSTACDLATNDNIGTIINVLQEEVGEIEGSAVTFTNGLYIVTGTGAVSKLGISSATGDVAVDIENLKAKTSVIENIIEGLYWETDDDLIMN